MKNAAICYVKIWLITAIIPPLIIATGAFLIRLPNNNEPVSDYLFLSLATGLFTLVYSLIPFLLLTYTSRKSDQQKNNTKWRVIASTIAALLIICFDAIKNNDPLHSVYIWLIYITIVASLIIIGNILKK